MDPAEHWQQMYMTRLPTEVGWYEPDPAMSRRLVTRALDQGAESVIDVGGGASSLVDHLLDLGVERIAVLDISEAGIALSRRRLAQRAAQVQWMIGDVTAMEDVGHFDVWHDRAVFHFLLDPEPRRRYVALCERAVGPGGTAVIATFAPDGPERCSGLPVRRYDPDDLARELGPGWDLVDSERSTHTTPSGVEQPFVYSTLRLAGPAS